MSRPVQQAISNLIPRHSGTLPAELVELASSLLAQSRSQISNLKSEEEVARTYCCAHVACERLKTTLNLPPIEPRPPIPPRTYNKLYSHFNKTLISSSSSSSARKRSRQQQSASDVAEPSRRLPSRPTPSKSASLATYHRGEKTRLRYGASSAVRDKRLPRWVGPAIRLLCEELDAGRAAAHVYAGVESVMFLPCPAALNGNSKEKVAEGEEKKIEGKLPALIAAVWFYVNMKMVGRETDAVGYGEQKKKVARLLRGLKVDERLVTRVGLTEAAWDGLEGCLLGDVDRWIVELTRGGWLEMEWYENLIDGEGVSGEVAVDVDADLEDEQKVDDDLERAKRRKREWGKDIGRGTMMQDDYDYLSNEKREAYAAWKEAILATIDKHSANGRRHEDMEVDITQG